MYGNEYIFEKAQATTSLDNQRSLSMLKKYAPGEQSEDKVHFIIELHKFREELQESIKDYESWPSPKQPLYSQHNDHIRQEGQDVSLLLKL